MQVTYKRLDNLFKKLEKFTKQMINLVVTCYRKTADGGSQRRRLNLKMSSPPFETRVILPWSPERFGTQKHIRVHFSDESFGSLLNVAFKTRFTVSIERAVGS